MEQPKTFDEEQRKPLMRLFHINLIYLAVCIAASLSTSIYFLIHPPQLRVFLALTGGLLGSAVAALISCVQRHADGFEDSWGGQAPARKETTERFSEGMYYWFLVRPWLGAVVGAVAYWGLMGKVFGDQGDLDADLPRLAFYSFIAGLLAKSLLEIFSGVLKNIFKK